MQIQGIIDTAVAEVGQVLLGKDVQIRLALCCLFARGHLLIEDLPGMGKTTLSHALAQVLGLSWKRVQFTSDLLPADILGDGGPGNRAEVERLARSANGAGCCHCRLTRAR